MTHFSHRLIGGGGGAGWSTAMYGRGVLIECEVRERGLFSICRLLPLLRLFNQLRAPLRSPKASSQCGWRCCCCCWYCAYRKQKVNINNTRKMLVSNFVHFLPDAVRRRAYRRSVCGAGKVCIHVGTTMMMRKRSIPGEIRFLVLEEAAL